MFGGEAHYLWGKAYRLKVITTDKHPKVEVDKQYIIPNPIIKALPNDEQ